MLSCAQGPMFVQGVSDIGVFDEESWRGIYLIVLHLNLQRC